MVAPVLKMVVVASVVISSTVTILHRIDGEQQ
jgi:hypothetical protein